MSFQKYVYIWLLLVLLIAWEYLALNGLHNYSLIQMLQTKGLLDDEFNRSTEPGRPISYWLGVIGFSIMCLTNIYILRKRALFMSKWGRLSGWLDFHIFCGMLGPTLIVFHSDFKVGGLVAISFWCMTVSATSGVVGRYVYVRVLRKKANLSTEVKKFEGILATIREKSKAEISDEVFENMKSNAVYYVGGPKSVEDMKSLSLPVILFRSFLGDIKLSLADPRSHRALPERKTRAALAFYALASRNYYFFGGYQRLLGHWHSFHLPFAIFMYLTAIIHIVVALLFGIAD